MNLTDKNKGFICSASASALWGILPLFWNLLKQVPSDQILAHRIVWALAFMVIYISSIGKKGQLLRSFLHPKNIGLVFLATLFNCGNWYLDSGCCLRKISVDLPNLSRQLRSLRTHQENSSAERICGANDGNDADLTLCHRLYPLDTICWRRCHR